MTIRFIRSARKHRVGYARAREVMSHGLITVVRTRRGDFATQYAGADSTGRQLTVIAIADGEDLVVIHVQPTYR